MNRAPRYRSLCIRFLSFLLSAIVLEASARIVFLLPPRFWFTGGSAGYRISWTQGHRILLSLHSNESLLLPFDLYDPLLGWRLKPDLRKSDPIRSAFTVTSNSSGLRGVTEFNEPRTPGKTRIVVIGDSFTFGEDVDDEVTYCSQLQKLLPRAEILNMGIHAYGHDQMLLRLSRDGLRYHPDVVLLGFQPVQVPRNPMDFTGFAKPFFEINGSTLQLRNVPVPSPLQVLRWEPFRLKVVDLISLAWYRSTWGSRRRQAVEEQLWRKLLGEIVRVARAAGAVPVLMTGPDGGQCRQLNAGQDPDVGRSFLEFCHQQKIRCFSVAPMFLAYARAGVPLATGAHWDAVENGLVARGIRDYLVAEHLLSSQGEPLDERPE